jgi:beta-ureidopropionase
MHMSTYARIATICACHNYAVLHTVESNRSEILAKLDQALLMNPDCVCLPETLASASVQDIKSKLCETVPGPTTDNISKKARDNGCYIICPIATHRDNQHYNSAVIIGRKGEIIGIYDKAHPVTTNPIYTEFENGLSPGTEDVPVFDLDFGRIGIQICFDAIFPDSWRVLGEKGAQLVFWPSAYDGGLALQSYALLHQYFVVTSSRLTKSKVIDPLGNIRAQTDDLVNVIFTDINLDFAVCHFDFNYGIPEKISGKYGGDVAVYSDHVPERFLVEPRRKDITIKMLQNEFEFETLSQYRNRHETAYRALRKGEQAKPQNALHKSRAQYGK